MFFKKKKEEKIVPIDEVLTMTTSGMSDKDIIKELKSKGYSYDEIEKAMLQAVRAGVGTEEPKKEEEIDVGKIPELDMPQHEAELEMPEMMMEERSTPELVIEEIVEGVVNEKLDRFEKRFDELGDEIKKIKMMKSEVKELPTETKDDTKLDDINNRIDDLEARIGGLEKAFRQFLPSLTKNIESLSGMIHEMKMKKERVYEEAV